MPQTKTRTKTTGDEAAVKALVPSADRAGYDAKVRALLARNATLELLEQQRAEQKIKTIKAVQ